MSTARSLYIGLVQLYLSYQEAVGRTSVYVRENVPRARTDIPVDAFIQNTADGSPQQELLVCCEGNLTFSLLQLSASQRKIGVMLLQGSV